MTKWDYLSLRFYSTISVTAVGESTTEGDVSVNGEILEKPTATAYELLKKYGSEGWELVNVARTKTDSHLQNGGVSSSTFTEYIFKRPLE